MPKRFRILKLEGGGQLPPNFWISYFSAEFQIWFKFNTFVDTSAFYIYFDGMENFNLAKCKFCNRSRAWIKTRKLQIFMVIRAKKIWKVVLLAFSPPTPTISDIFEKNRHTKNLTYFLPLSPHFLTNSKKCEFCNRTRAWIKTRKLEILMVIRAKEMLRSCSFGVLPPYPHNVRDIWKNGHTKNLRHFLPLPQFCLYPNFLPIWKNANFVIVLGPELKQVN